MMMTILTRIIIIIIIIIIFIIENNLTHNNPSKRLSAFLSLLGLLGLEVCRNSTFFYSFVSLILTNITLLKLNSRRISQQAAASRPPPRLRSGGR
jgi:hypothetical protein